MNTPRNAVGLKVKRHEAKISLQSLSARCSTINPTARRHKAAVPSARQCISLHMLANLLHDIQFRPAYLVSRAQFSKAGIGRSFGNLFWKHTCFDYAVSRHSSICEISSSLAMFCGELDVAPIDGRDNGADADNVLKSHLLMKLFMQCRLLMKLFLQMLMKMPTLLATMWSRKQIVWLLVDMSSRGNLNH